MKPSISCILLAPIITLILSFTDQKTTQPNVICENEALISVVSYIHTNFPNYTLVDSSFILPSSISALYRDSLIDGTICSAPLFYSYDLNEDGSPEYVTFRYKIEENLHTPQQADSMYTMHALLVFSDGEKFSHTEKTISFSTGIYQDKKSLMIDENIAFIKPGTYKRAYFFNDSIYIHKPGLVIYSDYGASIMLWENADSSKSVGLYAD